MKANWENILKDRLQLYGHRNWVVIADSAYPAQSQQGIETIVADDEQADVIERALAILRECKHVKPTVYTDEELRFVPEKDAPGVTKYREQLASLLTGYEDASLRHEDIISMLDRVGETFRVLLIKTNMRIPYTSVFLELECGYWNADADQRLRAVMRPTNRNRNAIKRSRKH
ncbi:MAG TPA: hypothetical protein VE779_14120 [Candidatus Angelobacter sp.]|jgi:L-fucose mutarotase/ribose pyranase (RbsD/FucU family)|nr:hypothetical protein [Candidatus Angelobacter sp.]